MPWTWTPLHPWALQVEKTLHTPTLARQGKQQLALLRRRSLVKTPLHTLTPVRQGKQQLALSRKRSLVLWAGHPRMGRRCIR